MEYIKFETIKRYFVFKVELIKNYLVNVKNKSKQRINEYFAFENSLSHLESLLKTFYIIPSSFDEINCGIKNPINFQICILFCIFMWITTLHLLPFIISDYLFSFVNNQFLPNHFRIWLLLLVFLVGLITVSRTDFLIGVIQFNLEPLKAKFKTIKSNILRVVYR